MIEQGRQEPAPRRRTKGPAGRSWLRPLTGALAVVGGLGGTLVAGAVGAAPAFAASGQVGVYQVGLSQNCNVASSSPTCSGGGLGGQWGWATFTDSASDPNDPYAGYGGDAQFTGCLHGSGAGHSVMDFRDWYVAVDPTMGIPVFFASWTETDTFQGQSTTTSYTDQSTGIPAFTIHRATLIQFFGQPLPAGSSLNVQVAWKPPAA